MAKAKLKSAANTPTLGDLAGKSYLALKIVMNPKITFATKHVSGKGGDDAANSHDNIWRTLLFKPANRSSYKDGAQTGPGGTAYLDDRMLKGMLGLADKFSFHVSEIAGGVHGSNSKHYSGIGFDVVKINGSPVSAKDNTFKEFMKQAKALGASEVLGPGSPGHDGHIHIAWPRQ